MEAINRTCRRLRERGHENNLTPYATLGGRTVYGGVDHARHLYSEDTMGITPYYNSVVNRRLDEEYAMLYPISTRLN